MALQIANAGAAKLLQWALAQDTIMLGLYSTNYTPAATDTSSNYLPNQPTFTGYSLYGLPAGGWGSATTVTGGVQCTYTQPSWTVGNPCTVYGCFVMDQADN